MSEPCFPFSDRAPQDDPLTAYDEAHLATYLRLLDAVAEGAAPREIASRLFGIDFDRERARARPIYETHLDRVRWRAARGCAQLLRAPSPH